jgi:hypothetical protein
VAGGGLPDAGRQSGCPWSSFFQGCCATIEYGVDVIWLCRHTWVVTRVEFHPVFACQYEALCRDDTHQEIAGEITQLIDALETHGHLVEGDAPDDPSHPIVISRLHMYALRRTPPTTYTPYADEPPVIRIPYVWFVDTETGDELAVVRLMSDKTELNNDWYPVKVKQIELTQVPEWETANPSHRARVRRTR